MRGNIPNNKRDALTLMSPGKMRQPSRYELAAGILNDVLTHSVILQR